MMKALVLLAVLAQGGVATPPAATDIRASDVQAALARAIATGRDAPIRVVDAGGQYVGVSLTHRARGATSGGGSHETVTEVYHVLEGSGTMVTGGTIVPRRSDGSFPIQGGVSRRIAKGDLVIIPAGTPHGISEVQEDITFIEIRIDPGRVIKLQ
jgi:mannose-6-phosphate isomerase-like protein (cupin superfamily)